MKKLLIAILFLGAFFLWFIHYAFAATILYPVGGGTGWGYPGGLQAHTLLIGNGLNSIATATPSTSGFVLTSNGVSADPTFQANAASGTVGSGLQGQFPFYNANGTTLTATSTLFVTQSGNVGIASTTPYGRLSINGLQGVSTPLFVIGSSTTGNSIQPIRFLVDSNGNTVIGSTTASQKLDIYSGAIRFSYEAPLPAPTVALAGAGAGNVPNGTYVYKLQCGNALGDGFLGATSTPVTVTDNTTNGQIALTLPLCPDPSMTIRRLWRSNNNGASLSWLAFGRGSQGASFNNNTATTFTDNVATPSDNFGNIPSDAFDSGYIFGDVNKGYSISAQGNSTITGNVGINGGRVTDNNGTLSLAVQLGSNKCGLYVADNFNQDCGSAYLSAVQSSGSKSILYLGKITNNVSQDPTGNGLGWNVDMGYNNATGNISSVGFGARIVTQGVTNTGTTYAFVSKDYLQSTTLSNYVAFDSFGQFATSNSTVINQYDFRADDFGAGGTTTNRYGLYLNYNPTAISTKTYGVYQTNNGVINYFGGVIGLATTSPSFGAFMSIGASTAATSSLVMYPGVAPTTPLLGAMWIEASTLFHAWYDGITHYVSSNLYTSIADATINTTGDTSAFNATNVTGYVGTTTIPASWPKAGKKFHISGEGVYSTPLGNVSTVTIKIKYGATTVASVTTGALPASASNLPFHFDADCTFRAVGASGTIICNGNFAYDTALTGIVETQNALISNAVTVDTTAQSNIDVTGAWSAVTTQVATVQQSSIDFKN